MKYLYLSKTKLSSKYLTIHITACTPGLLREQQSLKMARMLANYKQKFVFNFLKHFLKSFALNTCNRMTHFFSKREIIWVGLQNTAFSSYLRERRAMGSSQEIKLATELIVCSPSIFMESFCLNII